MAQFPITRFSSERTGLPSDETPMKMIFNRKDEK